MDVVLESGDRDKRRPWKVACGGGRRWRFGKIKEEAETVVGGIVVMLAGVVVGRPEEIESGVSHWSRWCTNGNAEGRR